MSGGPVCLVKGHDHVVIARHQNNSAFSGYRRKWSRYSAVRCLQTGMVWRSAASYVSKLPDITPEQANSVGPQYDARSRRST